VEADFVAYDERFATLLLPGATVDKLATGTSWAEGPVYRPDSACLLWSDVRNNRMLRWSEDRGTTVFREPSDFSNGNTLDLEERLVTCEHGRRRVSRTEADGTVVTVVDNYRGRRLNSPNDLVVRSDGAIWFTDPPYGILSNDEGYQAESELGANYVFRFDPASGELDIVADDFHMPNGIAFSPDERTLYVSDTGSSHSPDAPCHIRAFDVADGRRLTGGRVFADFAPGRADGFRIDVDGNLYAGFNTGEGVQVYSPEGERIGRICIPEPASNCAFGGPPGNRLFITASTSLYSVLLNTTAATRPR